MTGQPLTSTRAPANGTAAADTPRGTGLRPSQTHHGPHAIAQLERPTCARCGREPAVGFGNWPAYGSVCNELMQDMARDAQRELDDARAEAGL